MPLNMLYSISSLSNYFSSVPSMPVLPLLPRGTDITFKYQSQSISFSEWLSLLTLAFAPLIAHIFVGVAEPIVLSAVDVSWKERICHYNPTSIIWRYFAITDRRCRARIWTQYDMAASNAVFWNGRHWDGSVEIMNRKKDLATKYPASNHVSWASTSIFQTLIVSLQGIQAAYTIVIHAEGREAVPTHPISQVFFPLAVLGLLRLPAAFWLTEEYGYREREDPEPHDGDNIALENLLSREQSPPASTYPHSEQFYPESSWRGVVVRIGFLGALLVFTAASITSMATNIRPDTKTGLPALLTGIYYLFLLICTISTFSVYIWTEKSNTTVIPCIESPAYKVYTYGLFLITIGYIVVTALETRRAACGLYTTTPIEWGQDDAMCKSYQAF